MKAEIEELEVCFSIKLEPEDMDDQIKLVRLGFNHTKEIRSVYVGAYKDLSMGGAIVLGKRKDSTSIIGRK